MSNNCTREKFEYFLNELKIRYIKTREGYKFNFEKEIEPFLSLSIQIKNCIDDMPTDSRFTVLVRDKLTGAVTEIAMSCHVDRFSKKLFNETYKYITHWCFYLLRREEI